MSQGVTVIINCGIGNVNSLKNACLKSGEMVVEISDASILGNIDISRVMLPGVGAVGPYLQMLRQKGFADQIKRLVLEHGTPFLGICVGMQALATKCEEFGTFDGLNLIPGEVKSLRNVSENVRLPHVGWNSVNFVPGKHNMAGLEGENFYFVHSNHYICADDYIVGTTFYGKDFVSIVKRGNIQGVQFHPEKSSRVGEALIKKFISTGSL